MGIFIKNSMRYPLHSLIYILSQNQKMDCLYKEKNDYSGVKIRTSLHEWGSVTLELIVFGLSC